LLIDGSSKHDGKQLLDNYLKENISGMTCVLGRSKSYSHTDKWVCVFGKR